MRLPFILFLAALLPACTQTTEERAQALVSSDIQAHFTRGADYHAERFRSRPYTRYDSLVYLARTAALNADTAGHRPAVVLPPRRPQDTVRLGTFVHHIYRAPGPDGNDRLDSADYVVSSAGRVTELLPGQLTIKN